MKSTLGILLQMASGLVLAATLALPTVSRADGTDPLTAAMTQMCGDKSRKNDDPNNLKVEGAYDIKVWVRWQTANGMQSGQIPLRLYLICQSSTNMVAAVSSPDVPMSAMNVTMVYQYLNKKGTNITFSTMDISSSGMSTSGGTAPSNVMVVLSLAELLKGHVKGTYVSGLFPSKIDAQRVDIFPDVREDEKKFEGQTIDGLFDAEPKVYELQKPRTALIAQRLAATGVTLPAYLFLLAPADNQMILFYDPPKATEFLLWGQPTDGAGNVFYVSDGTNTANSGKGTLTLIRGRFVGGTDDRIEFFHFNTAAGVISWLDAKKLDDAAAEKILSSAAVDLNKLQNALQGASSAIPNLDMTLGTARSR